MSNSDGQSLHLSYLTSRESPLHKKIMAGAAGESNFGVLGHSQSMSNHTQTHIIEEFEQHLSLASTQGQDAAGNAYNTRWIAERLNRMDLAGFDWIVAKETWSVPTVLTSSQMEWILIKTTVNEHNLRLMIGGLPLGTFKIKSLKIYMAESHGLREILRNNVLQKTDDILYLFDMS